MKITIFNLIRLNPNNNYYNNKGNQKLYNQIKIKSIHQPVIAIMLANMVLIKICKDSLF